MALSSKRIWRALAAYRNGDSMGFNECCRQYGIPKPTLKRHLDGKNVKAVDGKKSMGRLTTLSPEIEEELVKRIQLFEDCLFGMTILDVRKLAYQIAESMGIPHYFNVDNKMAGKKWYYGFMARHKNISLRQPQGTSLAKAKGFNRENVQEFFEILTKTVDENKIDATHIYNVDETGVSTVQNKCRKVLAEKGKRAVGSITSGERGVNTTVVCCSSASGSYVPPMIIYKRMRMTNELKVGAPPGSLVQVSETGYINTELFVKWLRHFIEVVKPTKEKKVLLLLDGHSTHSKNLEALDVAREAGIVLLQLPGHTTHRLQPLDRSFFEPFKGYFTQAVEKWLRTSPGLGVTKYQISSLSNEAYGKAATIENAENGFKCSRVWPVDPLIFKETDFLPAVNLTLPIQPTNNTNEDEVVISPEMNQSSGNNTNSVNKVAIISLQASLEALSPLPKPKKKRARSANPNAQKSVVLTSSPYKKDLELTKELKMAREKVKELQMKVTVNKTGNSTKNSKNHDLDLSLNNWKKPMEVFLNQATTSNQPDVMIKVHEEDWFCAVCEENYVEDMVQCVMCKNWVHEGCAGSKAKIKKFVCSNCEI